ncbi:MAG: AAA family ATPase [Actinomycetia bacterium]|nr:AAA family ATPase [Actinomycetes bacterium]
MTDRTANTGSRASALTALLNDAPKPDDHEQVRKFMHALAEHGCSVLLIWPDSKLPADMRSVQKRTRDDKLAREAAKAAGRLNWEKVKSPSGLALATTDTAILDAYLDAYIKNLGDDVAVNLAVELGQSRLVVVDADTAAQVEAFRRDADTAGDPVDTATVSTPGAQNSTGDWLHSDGGHWYFAVPEGVELPESPGALSLGAEDSRYSVLWHRRYVLIPPSRRPEGSYTVTGDVRELPDWLCERITSSAQLRADRAQRHRDRDRAGDDAVAKWGETVTWAEILEPIGWTPTGKVDLCGCETWTAPGDHASPKSATGHEPGTCGEWDTPDAPLYIWTDHDCHPFDTVIAQYGPTVTRLRAVAAIHYDNDIGAAMTALDLHDDDLAVDDLPADFGKTPAVGKKKAEEADNQGTNGGRSLHITWASEIEPEPVDWLWVDIALRNSAALAPDGTTAPDPYIIEDIACVAPGRTWSPPEVESDGRIACGMVSIAAGREGSGKSSFGIWLAAKITRGTLPGAHYGTPKRVYYLATEDSWQHTLVPRLMAAGADLTKVARIEVAVSEHANVTLSLPDDVELLTKSIIDNDVVLVIVDPLMSTIGAGLDANGSRDVRTALEPVAAMADKTGAAVVALAHFNKATGLDSLTRITGSGAFKDVARAVMVFAVDADGERVFSQPKNSVGRNDLPSLKYEVTGAVVETAKGKAATARFTFTGIAESTVDDSLGNEHRPGASGKSAGSQVEQFIADYIADHTQPETDDGGVPAADVIAAGAEAGYSERQIKDARPRATDPVITSQRIGFGPGSYWVWKVARKAAK